MRVGQPPPTPREDVVDVLWGERVADPYRWLEDAADQRVRAWTDAQNERTRVALEPLPQRAPFAARLRELLAIGLLGTPVPAGGRIFHVRREGDQKQAVLYVREGVDGADRALVDPNALDAQGLLTLDWYYPSPDGRLVAYGISRGGTELSTLHVSDVASGRALGLAIPHTQRSQVAWRPEGFYYVVHPAPGTVPAGDEHYHRRVRFHSLSEAPPSADHLVFGEGRPKEDIVGVQTSPDGRWVLFSAARGWASNDLYLLDRADAGRRLVPVVETRDGMTFAQLGADGLWLRTNLGAPCYRIVHAPYERPTQWRDVIAEAAEPIEDFAITRAHLVVHRLTSATSRLAVHERDGRLAREVALPDIGAIASSLQDADLHADRAGDLACFVFQSFERAPAAFAVDARDGVLRPQPLVALRSPRPRVPLVTEQVRYRSRDGTEVPMFLVRARAVRPTGDLPAVLTGYGGFNVSRLPLYSAAAILCAESGGVFALANLRGGAEFGEAWHRAGMLERKQTVFDDFHAAAEHLIASGWTRAARLGAFGGSNGGLLMGAAMTQRPELFAAIVCTVPLLDMLRYQGLLIARLWIPEYGSSEDAAQFRWLRAYSPYHNVRDGVHFPPVLFTTAEGDSRVDPMHARKMAALLQSLGDRAPTVLLRVDHDAGHGIGKPLDKQVDDLVDQWAFLAAHTQLGARTLVA